MLRQNQRSASVSDAVGRGHDLEFLVAVESDVPILITSARDDARLDRAQAIHAQGGGRDAPFVAFDCGSWRDPAERRHAGVGGNPDEVSVFRRRLREASDGTLFVDRVETMSDDVQAELFGVFERTSGRSGVSAPSGAPRPRILSGASRSLMGALAAGTFHEGLFYRLNVIHLDLTSQHHPKEDA